MTFVVRCDFREKEIIHEFEKKIDVQTLSLNLGDIEIFDETTQKPVAILERKTVDDLANSIKDGRYREQSLRLQSCVDSNETHVFYIIEGTIREKHQKIPNATLLTAICSLSLKFKLLKTNDVSESVDMILALKNKLEKCSKPKNESIPTYSSVIKSVKKENIRPENFGMIVLCQIPGVSSKTAMVIMDHYKTINNLILDKDKKATLESLTIGKKKLSKTMIKNIVLFMEKM